MATLRSVFGHTAFRPLQEEVIQAVLERRDVFVLMPTGGGKSLCYQLPALLRDGLTVVVSPLIALMKDQVDALQALGVAATFINSSLESSEIERRQAAVARGETRLLYVAPERLLQPGFLRLLGAARVDYFAVDEAHCISEWGHDFRPEYRDLRRLRELFPRTPLGAFTATATRRVQNDIVDQLRLQRGASFRGSFNRPNLFYDVRPKQGAYDQLRSYLRRHRDESGIIYCHSRANADTLAERLRQDGFDAISYHAGLESDERRQRQEAFDRDDARIVVATVAFGMGIDKPDVRFVVHYDLPKNLEGYYQESGRAGRDGEPADCILFYSYGDVAKYERFIEEKSSEIEKRVARQQLRQMADWAASVTCRRRVLLSYFDESFDGQDGPCCDVCRTPREEVDYTIPAQMYLSCVKRTGERFGSAHLIDVLRGSKGERVLRLGHDRLSTYGIGRDRPKEEWQHLARELIRGGYVVQDADDFNAIKVTERGRAVLSRGEKLLLSMPRAPSGSGADDPSTLTDGSTEARVFAALRAWRKDLADERGVAPFVIFHDRVLRDMARTLPRTADDLGRIPGIGERKVSDLGPGVLAVIARVAPPRSEPPVEGERIRSRRPAGALGDTVLQTLALFRAGRSVSEIIATRGLAPSTVEGHLAEAVEAGEDVDLDRLVKPARREEIARAIAVVGDERLRPILDCLGEGYTYGEVRFVRAALRRNQAGSEKDALSDPA